MNDTVGENPQVNLDYFSDEPFKILPSDECEISKNQEKNNEENAFSFNSTDDRKLFKISDGFRITRSFDCWWLLLLSVTLLSLVTRLHYITMPNSVIWDEAHFGKMASWYLNRTFFFDVHPPGAKLMLTLFGYLAGYNGTHSFEMPGLSYEGYECIVYIRVGCALVGAAMVPASFCIAWELTGSLMASVLGSLFCLFEIGTITLSKFILLDPFLMLLILLSFHGLCKVINTRDSPWTQKWWLALAYTGVCLGCVMSVKFVGVFTVLMVGSYVILDLWALYCDTQNSLLYVGRHLVARGLCLILLPLLIYVSIFVIHDQVLYRAENVPNKGDLGLGSFSAGFQMVYVNSSLYNLKQPTDVSYGNLVTLRNAQFGGGYLHSHNASYPQALTKSSKPMQQITSFRAKDANNVFRILFPSDDPEMSNGFYAGEQETLTDGNWIRLHHFWTNASLACSRNRSLVATKLYMTYAEPYNLTDPQLYEKNEDLELSIPHNLLWKLSIADQEKGGANITALETRFQLICPTLKCALTWSKENLPYAWGFGQGEISCTRNLRDPNSIWMVEQNTNPYLTNATFEHMKVGFWQRFVESHRMMQWVNARLKPDAGSIDNLHLPWMWPLLYKSQPWFDNEFRVVLLGNPIIFLVNLLFLVVGPIFLLGDAFRKCRSGDGNPGQIDFGRERMLTAMRWLLAAYLFHYLPFFAMNRILYYHHYFPALQFSSLLTAVAFTYSVEELGGRLRRGKGALTLGLASLLVALIVASFYIYCYVGYGHPTQGPYNPDNSTYSKYMFNLNWEI